MRADINQLPVQIAPDTVVLRFKIGTAQMPNSPPIFPAAAILFDVRGDVVEQLETRARDNGTEPTKTGSQGEIVRQKAFSSGEIERGNVSKAVVMTKVQFRTVPPSTTHDKAVLLS